MEGGLSGSLGLNRTDAPALVVPGTVTRFSPTARLWVARPPPRVVVDDDDAGTGIASRLREDT